jgi:hypothetical protein
MFKRKQIWKLQRPIVSNEAFPTVMAYTEDKDQLAMIPMPEEMMDEIFGDELKVYALATVVNGVLKVKRLVPEQDW